MATATLTLNVTIEQSVAIDDMVARIDVRKELTGGGYSLDAIGYAQALFDVAMRGPVARHNNDIAIARLAKLAANPDVLAQVDALATPVALKP